MPTYTITGDQGTASYASNNQNFDIYECAGATFRVGKPSPAYPFKVAGSTAASVEARGGLTLGLLPPTTHRAKNSNGGTDGLYVSYNSAAVFVQSIPAAHIHDWTFGTDDWRTATGHCWDLIRINGHNAGDWLIEKCWGRGNRDDAVESDSVTGGSLTIDTCLFEACYAGISCTGDQSARLITMRNSAMCLTNNFEDESEGDAYRTFGPMFKPDASGQHGPQFYLENTVLAYETWDGAAMSLAGQPGTGRVAEAFRRMTCGPNVYMCVLAAGSLPAGFPALPAGMTLLTGTAARNKWDDKRTELIATMNGAPSGGGLITRNVCSFVPSTQVITIDRRLTLPSTTFTLTATNPAGSDTEDFAVNVID